MIMQKTTYVHKNRNAKTVDEFYYRGMEGRLNGLKGTGIRLLAADFIRKGRILSRSIILKDEGCVLEIHTLFADFDAINDFNSHPYTLKAKKFFSDKPWTVTNEIYPVDDYMNVGSMLDQLPELPSKS
jgi:hypothetical protein